MMMGDTETVVAIVSTVIGSIIGTITGIWRVMSRTNEDRRALDKANNELRRLRRQVNQLQIKVARMEVENAGLKARINNGH